MNIDRRSLAAAACAILMSSLFGASPVAAQQGDRPGETQPDPPAWIDVPPAPVLAPDEALASLTVKPGFRVELVAHEPLVEDPVTIAFDADGRIWVVEMRGYMPDVDGTGEREPVGRIVVLTDVDGDGQCDESRVFLDGLVLPRGVAPVRGGALVIEPPDLVFHRDTDGDGRADERTVLYTGFRGLESPEHAGNGLLAGIDNWLYCSQHPLSFRFDGVSLDTRPTPGHGQWGITHDDTGRLYYNTNSDPLRVDLFPMHYAARNPNLSRVRGINERAARDFAVYPARVTPGINRGYEPGMLRDGKLTKFTSACGPAVYRGAAFPSEFHGNAFVCEPAAHLVKRYVLEDVDHRVRAVPAYGQSEFLTSTDERFRPVNACTGPDGALYLVDMYRGVIQHRIFVTTFLRKQIVARELDRPVGLGRIYRIVPDDAPVRARPNLATMPDAGLVRALQHPNGWWRDTAQRLLVERGATGIAPRLRRLLGRAPERTTRLHALWTLDGLGVASFEDVERAGVDVDPVVRAAAVRVAERWGSEPRMARWLDERMADPAHEVQVQVAFSLGEIDPVLAAPRVERMLVRWADVPDVRTALVSGLAGRELALIESVSDSVAWRREAPGPAATLRLLVGCAVQDPSPRASTRLLDVAAASVDARPWQSRVILDRFITARRLRAERPPPTALGRAPHGWSRVLSASEPEIRTAAELIQRTVDWPGKQAVRQFEPPRELLPVEATRFERGQGLYGMHCASCHQDDGRGRSGIAPPLVGTTGVLGSERRLARILLHGMRGEIEVGGARWDAPMPKVPLSSDDALAAILTYVRRAWGNTADPVAPEVVSRARNETRDRREPYSVSELELFR